MNEEEILLSGELNFDGFYVDFEEIVGPAEVETQRGYGDDPDQHIVKIKTDKGTIKLWVGGDEGRLDLINRLESL